MLLLDPLPELPLLERLLESRLEPLLEPLPDLLEPLLELLDPETGTPSTNNSCSTFCSVTISCVVVSESDPEVDLVEW